MFSKERLVAGKAAMEAGKIIMGHFKKGFSVKKKGRIDLVTDADVAAEKKIVSVLSKAFPKDDFLGEESGKKSSSAKRMWVIDPVDGTTNFSHGFPWFATSIGLLEDKKEVLGVVFDPVRKDLYIAARGGGAFLNGKRIFVSKNGSLVESVVATGFPYERGELAQKTVQSIGNLTGECQGLRRLGSAVLDLMFVARGSLDGFFEYKLFPWDVCAGILIVREAGGKVTTIDGRHATTFDTHFLATNGLIHDELLKRLAKP